jgi:hypothetical protein
LRSAIKRKGGWSLYVLHEGLMSRQRTSIWITAGLGVAVICVIVFVVIGTRRGLNPFQSGATEKKLSPASASNADNQYSKTAPGEAPITPSVSNDDENKSFWLTLRASGFQTKEMSISAGEYFVIIHNASGLDQFGVRIRRESGESVHEVRLSKFQKRWRQNVRFNPGNYIISEIDHPEWTCRITVTASGKAG